MADLMFRRGRQTNLPSVADNGCFYLTTDTNRLYVGNEDNAMVLLSQNIQIIERIGDLPDAPYTNEFYYCSKDNVFAFYDGSEWKQINPDTNDNDNDTIEVSGLAFEKDDATSSEEQVVYNVTVSQTKTDINGNTSDLDPVVAQLTLKSSDIASIVPEAATVGLDTNIDGNNGVAITTKGDGSDSEAAIYLRPGDNVTQIAADGSEITIDVKDTTYTFEVAAANSSATLVLTNEEDGSSTEIEFAVNEANDDLTISAEENKVIYGHKTYEAPAESSVENKADLSAQGELKIISGLTISNGHVADVAIETLTLPDDTKIDEVTQEEAWKATILETGAGNSFDIDFSEDAAALKEELEETIRSGLAAANTALTYKGTISSYSELLGKSNVEVGDVWLLDRESTYGGETYKAGDMFIATSSDADAAGVITDVEWTYVPSGDELNTDTRFYGDVEIESGDEAEGGGQVTFTVKAEQDADGNENIPDDNEALVLIAGTDISITGSGTEATIAHKVYEDDVVTDEGEFDDVTSVTAITSLTIENGHVTGATAKTFNLATYELEGSDNSIKLIDANGNDDAITVNGDDWITATVDGDVFAISHNAPQTATNEIIVTNNEQLSSGDSIDFISGVLYDDAGHIVEVQTDSVTLPESKLYELAMSADNASETVADEDVENPYIILKDDNGDITAVRAQGDSNGETGSVSVVGTTDGFKVTLVWGSF